MNNFNLTEWADFNIKDLFFVTTSKDTNLFNSNMGNTPYVAASSENNGVTAYIDAEPSQQPNTLTIARNGSVGSTFYQPKPYCASPDDVRILTPRFNMNVYNGLFIKTIIEREKFRYAYGRKLGTKRIENMTITLPVNSGGRPDFAYMENYINSLNAKPISTKVHGQTSPLEIDKWGEYTLGELFIFRKGKRLTKEDMIEGKVNFIGAISENNGVRQLIDVEPMYPSNCITVNYNGSVGEAFYQFESFWASDDVNVLYANGWELNKYVAMFIITTIKANRYKFSYGRKWTLEKMKESIIRLPKTANGSPDWIYMENYIKSLPYGDRI